MTNISSSQKKIATRALLFQIAIEGLEKKGWKVERIARSGKSSVRRITKGNISKKVSIRTSQDTWIAFPRTANDDGWATLEDVDYVIAASVDDRENPQFGQVHMIEGDEMRARFDRAYAARKKAGYTIHRNRGIWVSLYDKESDQPVTHVGAGAGLDHPTIAREPLSREEGNKTSAPAIEGLDAQDIEMKDRPLTIADAKRRLAVSFGVDESDIKITISS